MAQLSWRKHGDHSRCHDLLDKSLQMQTNISHRWTRYRENMSISYKYSRPKRRAERVRRKISVHYVIDLSGRY
jgi:hypothetical protein